MVYLFKVIQTGFILCKRISHLKPHLLSFINNLGLMDMNKAFEAAEQIFGVIDRKSEIEPNPSAGLKLDENRGNIKVNDAVFSYPTRKSQKVLRSLKLSIEAGEKIALVGQSGNI